MGMNLGLPADSLLLWGAAGTIFSLAYIRFVWARTPLPIVTRGGTVLAGALLFASLLALLASLNLWRTGQRTSMLGLALLWSAGLPVGIGGCWLALRFAAGTSDRSLTAARAGLALLGFWLGAFGGYLMVAAAALAVVFLFGSR